MISDYNTRDIPSDSQNFTLHLSEGSIIEDTQDFSTNKMEDRNDVIIEDTQDVATDKMEDRNDVIVISDSDSHSSFEDAKVPDFKSDSNIKNSKKAIRSKYFLEISSENEENLDQPWQMRIDNKSSDRYRNKTIINLNKTIYTSDDTTVSSSNCDRKINCDRNKKNQINIHDDARSYRTPTSIPAEQKVAGKYSTNKQTDKVTTPSNTTHCSKVLSTLNHFQTRNTPQQNSAGKMKLTKEDTRKIWRNIKQTRITYDSLRERKEANRIIDESTDMDEDVIHPAVSPKSNKKLMHLDDDCDIIDTSLKDDIIPDSQNNSPKPSSMYDINHFLNTREEQLHRPLSEKKKRQIAEWLMANSPPGSRSDSSCSNVPPSTRNSKDSRNDSLERLEMNYETPNNRGRINKAQTAQHEHEKQTTIVRADRVIQSISTNYTHQTTLDRFIQKSRNNNSEFKTPDRSMLLRDSKPGAPVAIKTSELGINDCTDILDKLYGESWRDKANALLSTTEPRKTSVQTTNRAVQTERKPLSKKQYYTTDSESEESDPGKNKIKAVRRKKDPQKQREPDSFINDESLSDNGSESIYHTALTNPRTSTNSAVSKPSLPVSASVKRLQTICDTDTESKSHESSSDSRKSLGRKKLSFTDDESSSTSEFDPGDYIPPKNIYRKESAKMPQPSKTASRFVSTNNSVKYKSFLASLSKAVPMSNVHSDAKKYRLDYKNNKEALCKELYKFYNEKVFDDKLPRDMSIEWNNRMRGTAGYCYNKKFVKSLSGMGKSSRIVLATKILDTPDRLRDTLIHEMCHAAAWLLNDVSDGHGPFWTGWANKAMKTFPELPPIRRCHDYEIKTKFTYRCTGCGYSIGRHSKSLDVEKKRCGHCYGKFELLINKTTKSGTVQVQTPRKDPSGFALYVKQNYNSVKKEKSNIKHGEVMKLLGQQFSAIKIARKNDSDMPN